MSEILRGSFKNQLEILPFSFNPYKRGYDNALPYLITTSNLRAELAQLAGLSVWDINHDAEERTQQKALDESGLKSTVVLPYRRGNNQNSPPFPVELSIDKAMASWEKIKKICKEKNEAPPSGIVAIDSTWVVELPGIGSFVLQKPKDKFAEEALLRFLYEASFGGARLKSVSGITRIKSDITGKKIEYSTYMIEVDLGVLDPNLCLGSLKQRIDDNGHYAGGFSSIDIFGGLLDLVELDEKINIIIHNFGEGRSDRIVPPHSKDSFTLTLANDSSNRETLIMLSLGLIPQRLNNLVPCL